MKVSFSSIRNINSSINFQKNANFEKNNAFQSDKSHSSKQTLGIFLKLYSNLNNEFLKSATDLEKKLNYAPMSLFYSSCFSPKRKLEINSIKKYLQNDSLFNSLTEQKRELVFAVLEKIVICEKTKNGVCDEYLSNFISMLMRCHEVLLKNIIDNNIPIEIRDDAALFDDYTHASFIQNKKPTRNIDENGIKTFAFDKDEKYLAFAQTLYLKPVTVQNVVQNTYESLPHELAHAFDYYNGTKLNLTQQDFLTVNFNKRDNNLRFSPLPSCSKEFDKAFFDDYILMGKNDEKNGDEFGTTFDLLLKNPHFNYYLGVKSNFNQKNSSENIQKDNMQTLQFDDIVARKELFAQMIAYVTSGCVTDEEFNKRIEELFPNCLNFAREIIDKAK